MLNLPEELRAETLLNWLPRPSRRVSLQGQHGRNAYRDIAALESDDTDGITTVHISRGGLYDVLPEAMFHPVDRFDNIPANEYMDRIREEYSRQEQETADARRFFEPIDRFIMELSALVARIRDSYAAGDVLVDIIADNLAPEYAGNRFVQRMKRFLPMCRSIRGNISMLSLVLRSVLRDEGVCARRHNRVVTVRDDVPVYDCSLDSVGTCVYLGSEFGEKITAYDVTYWSDEECGGGFEAFVEEMKVFECFVNDWFVGVESQLHFDISTDALAVRLDDEVSLNYLNFNTNL